MCVMDDIKRLVDLFGNLKNLAYSCIPTPHNFLETYDMSQINMDLVKSNVDFLKSQCRFNG